MPSPRYRRIDQALLALALLGACSQGARSPTASPTVARSPSPSASAPPQATPPATLHPNLGATVVARRFPIAGCTVTYAHSHHDYPATDILAAVGCTVVAPVTGRVDEVTTVDHWNGKTDYGSQRGGLSFSIVGDDGVRYYGSHLKTITVRAGQRVTAGAHIGTVGTTGDARGTASHLHFGLSWPTKSGIWWVRRGEVYPWPYLDSWRAGGNKSPVAAVAAEHRRQGDVPQCHAAC